MIICDFSITITDVIDVFILGESKKSTHLPIKMPPI